MKIASPTSAVPVGMIGAAQKGDGVLVKGQEGKVVSLESRPRTRLAQAQVQTGGLTVKWRFLQGANRNRGVPLRHSLHVMIAISSSSWWGVYNFL